MTAFTRNAIFNYIANKIKTDYPNINCTSVSEIQVNKFPTASIRQIDEVRPTQNVTLDYQDEQVELFFEVQVYSNQAVGAENEAFTIMKSISNAFNELYFIQTYCQPVANVDTTVKRIVARFRRIFGGGDVMPTLSNQKGE